MVRLVLHTFQRPRAYAPNSQFSAERPGATPYPSLLLPMLLTSLIDGGVCLLLLVHLHGGPRLARGRPLCVDALQVRSVLGAVAKRLADAGAAEGLLDVAPLEGLLPCLPRATLLLLVLGGLALEPAAACRVLDDLLLVCAPMVARTAWSCFLLGVWPHCGFMR